MLVTQFSKKKYFPCPKQSKSVGLHVDASAGDVADVVGPFSWKWMRAGQISPAKPNKPQARSNKFTFWQAISAIND